MSLLCFSGVPRFTMKLSFHSVTFESASIFCEPPSRPQIPPQARGAKSATWNSFQWGMLVRSVCLEGVNQRADISANKGLDGPRRSIIWIHAQACPEVGLQIVCLLLCKAVAQLKPAIV